MAFLMVVDDDEDFALAVATALRNAGHEVKVEQDVSRAVGDMEQAPPDLVILDVMFPGNPSAGFELARALKRLGRKTRDVPILMLTAINSCLALGFGRGDIDEDWLPVVDFLEKPIDPEELVRRVSGLLGATAGPRA
jgi:CheY-like chemotaxis protein